jgi:alkyl hydroperoxide reductase subunit AhpC
MNLMMKHVFPLVVLLAGFVPRAGLGGLIGTPAPPLVVQEWINGKPVEIKAGTNIFVVEIWHASSPAKLAIITNLNDIQKRFKTNGVVVVGISDEPVEKIKANIQHDGTNIMNIEFAIAADNRRKTSLEYMKSIGQAAIPRAFVVGTNGNLLWHGPPLRGLDEALGLITTGQYDAERAGKIEVAAHQMEQYLNLVRRGDARARAAGNALLANRTNDVELLRDMAYRIVTAPKVNHDFAVAGRALDQAEKLATTTNMAPVMITRAVWLFESGKRDQGLTLATQAIASAQSPMDKTNALLCLHTMEIRLAAANTNQTPATQEGKDSAGKP